MPCFQELDRALRLTPTFCSVSALFTQDYSEQPMQNFSLFPMQYHKLCMKMKVMKTSVFRLQSQNKAHKRCDGLLHNAKANTKESESLPTRLQM